MFAQVSAGEHKLLSSNGLGQSRAERARARAQVARER